MGGCASNTVTEAADLPVLRHELADGSAQAVARIHFCVDTDGSVTDMKRLSSTGDDDADRIVRDTVATWSFEPFVHDGKPTKACSGPAGDSARWRPNCCAVTATRSSARS